MSALLHELIDGLQISVIMFGLLCNSLLKFKHCIDLHLGRISVKNEVKFQTQGKVFFKTYSHYSTTRSSYRNNFVKQLEHAAVI